MPSNNEIAVKRLLHIAAIFVALLVFILLGRLAYKVWVLERGLGPCAVRDRVMASSAAGDRVLLHETLCAGPAFSNGARLGLLRGAGGGERIFFEYEEANADPIVRWQDAGHLAVSIDRVDHIFAQDRMVDGVAVTYRIGTVTGGAR